MASILEAHAETAFHTKSRDMANETPRGHSKDRDGVPCRQRENGVRRLSPVVSRRAMRYRASAVTGSISHPTSRRKTCAF